ncbi:hypothetical protein [Curtobacterium sp. MCJR17_043]|nr:hypothetical protein [Curtobacterium sp. MCJR17_043]WIB35225.1 hypothetical protein DEJ15_12810 [Curtobacterium sp. MCJR17_043]
MQQLLQNPDVSGRRHSATTPDVVPVVAPTAWRGPAAGHGMIVGWR